MAASPAATVELRHVRSQREIVPRDICYSPERVRRKARAKSGAGAPNTRVPGLDQRERFGSFGSLSGLNGGTGPVGSGAGD